MKKYSDILIKVLSLGIGLGRTGIDNRRSSGASEPLHRARSKEVRHLYFATRKTEGLELKCIIKKNENLFQFSADIAAEGGE